MLPSEKLCLKLNDFQENVNTAFADLRKDCDFTNVTLACEDGNQIEAHKIILSASSPFFENLLKKNKHAHPLIYMKGINSEDLLAIVDFLYYGEANIYHDYLDSFLNLAKEIQLQGLNVTEDEGEEEMEDGGTLTRHYDNTIAPTRIERKHDAFRTDTESQNGSHFSQTNSEEQISFDTVFPLPKYKFSGDMKELDVKIQSLMCLGENRIRHGAKNTDQAYVCKVCGKESVKLQIRDHIESKHLEGVSIPCNLCEKTFRTRMALRKHIYCDHRNNKNNEDSEIR